MTHPHQNKILNPEQEKAVHFGEGPLLIIAGAGTGKTTVVTERIKHFITAGLANPAEILALTFTEKAAREMEERVDQAMPYGYTSMWISTFHSFCDRILRAEAVHIGLNPGYRLLGDADATMLVRKHLFEFALDYFRPLGNPNKFIGGMLNHFSRLKDEDVTPSEYAEWVKSKSSTYAKASADKEEEILENKKFAELAGAYQKYEELKVKEGVMDFGDLVSHTLTLFRTRKNILRNYQQQFKFILVDEFQDTNIAQNELVRLLAGNKQNITAVCDDDQSIYKFRGAAVSNVLSYRKHFPKSELIVLSKNYRSTQEILDKSYQLIQFNNPDRLEVKEGINKKLVSTRDQKGEQIIFLHANRVENEAEMVAKEIKSQIPKIKNVNSEEKYSWKSFAILVRANSHAEPFVRALERQGIPFQFLGPGQLFRQPEIKELIAYLQVLQNPTDDAALFKLLTMEYFALSPRDLVFLTTFARKQLLTLYEVLEYIAGKRVSEKPLPAVLSETIERISQIVGMFERHFKLMSRETAGQLLYYFLEDTGMLKSILDYKFPLDETKAGNITKFFNKLKTYEAEHEDASVTVVLDWIMLAMELGESPLATDTDWTSNDAVNILTIHSAKGLEFPIVFLVNLVSQRFPSTERREQIPIPEELIKEELPIGDYHLEEERRLFYVGMTRARDLLYFTAADFYGDGKREKKISPFVAEVLGEAAVSTPQFMEVNQLSLIDWKKNETPKKPPTTHHVNYLSFSQIETFKTCPLHYKLRYILQVPTPSSPALSFGTSIHGALRDFYLIIKQGEKVSEKLLLELMEKNWVKTGYTSKRYESEMKGRGYDYLRGYFAKTFDPQAKPLLLEQSFVVPIKNEKRFLKIGGKIDRVDDLGNGKIEIIDYKTGRIPTKREIDASLQLSMYALAATEIAQSSFGKQPEDILLTLYYFESQEKISTTRSKEQLEAEKEKIIATASEIETSDFSCSGNRLCANCEYKLFCGITVES
ncbi:MAG: ATP-dependent DNA helicase [Patescibacteria group bacterium]